MTLRGLLICSIGIGATSLMIGTFANATAQKHAASGELGSCAAYSGLPSEDKDTAGWCFIPAVRCRTGVLSLSGF
jgi:hypothetical protein